MTIHKSPLLYSFRRCPYAIRARMALILNDIPYEVYEVDLKNKPTTLLELSPKGTVPVLVLPDGKILDESLLIVDYALEYQHDSFTEALIHELADSYIPAVMRYKFADRHPGINLIDEQHKMLTYLKQLESILADTAFLNGDAMGKADIAILPFIRYLYRADETWFSSLPLDSVKRWFFDFFNSPLHQQVMKKLNFSADT